MDCLDAILSIFSGRIASTSHNELIIPRLNWQAFATHNTSCFKRCRQAPVTVRGRRLRWEVQMGGNNELVFIGVLRWDGIYYQPLSLSLSLSTTCARHRLTDQLTAATADRTDADSANSAMTRDQCTVTWSYTPGGITAMQHATRGKTISVLREHTELFGIYI